MKEFYLMKNGELKWVASAVLVTLNMYSKLKK